MAKSPVTGHDGPYPVPLEAAQRRVPGEWIDYNGHMNVAYYTMAFDQAVDAFLEAHLGLGPAHVAAAGEGPYVLQSSVCYLDELLEGQSFAIEALLVDADEKRLHLMLVMRGEGGHVAATSEQLLTNVDLTARRACPYPDWAQKRIARLLRDHADAPRPSEMGRPLGIRRKG